jgi:hypothetical protein
MLIFVTGHLAVKSARKKLIELYIILWHFAVKIIVMDYNIFFFFVNTDRPNLFRFLLNLDL